MSKNQMESMPSDSILSVYTDARTEYSKQLYQIIVPAIFKFFMELLKKARADVGGESRKVLYQYQTLLNEIPDWNMDKVYREIGALKDAIRCEYLEELITAVFLAHTKVLMAIRISKSDSKINISVPKVDHFLFKVLCETAKLFWKSTYLFRDDISNLDRQQNLRTAEQLVGDGVSTAVRAMIPVKNILRDCISGDDNGTSVVDTVTTTAETADVNEEKEQEPSPEKVEEVPETSENEIAVDDREETLSLASVEDLTSAQEADNQVTDSNVLHIDEEDREVSFAEFDSVFDGKNSNMHYDPKVGELNDGELIIEDGPGESLMDFDEVVGGSDEGGGGSEAGGEAADMPLTDYEELVC